MLSAYLLPKTLNPKPSTLYPERQVQSRLVPPHGKLCEIFKEASEIQKDPRAEVFPPTSPRPNSSLVTLNLEPQ